jgi:hypothetical protein
MSIIIKTRKWSARCRRPPLGEKVLDCPINWKLAINTFAENYHFATVHKTTFATIARSNCTVFDSFGQHHRLVFPLNGILDLEDVPEEQWLVEHLQANLKSGVREHLVFGRNEPGLKHRHQTWAEALTRT